MKPMVFDDEVKVFQGARCIGRIGFEIVDDGNARGKLLNVYIQERDREMLVIGPGNTTKLITVSLTPTPSVFEINGFSVPSGMRGGGVARYIWHRIYHYFPNQFDEQLMLNGSLSSVNNADDMGARRDRLWQDVCGFTQNHPNATFVAQSGNGLGSFSGPLHDPWDRERSNLQIVRISSEAGIPDPLSAGGREAHSYAQNSLRTRMKM